MGSPVHQKGGRAAGLAGAKVKRHTHTHTARQEAQCVSQAISGRVCCSACGLSAGVTASYRGKPASGEAGLGHYTRPQQEHEILAHTNTTHHAPRTTHSQPLCPKKVM